jgi:hypothetical protein
MESGPMDVLAGKMEAAPRVIVIGKWQVASGRYVDEVRSCSLMDGWMEGDGMGECVIDGWLMDGCFE